MFYEHWQGACKNGELFLFFCKKWATWEYFFVKIVICSNQCSYAKNETFLVCILFFWKLWRQNSLSKILIIKKILKVEMDLIMECQKNVRDQSKKSVSRSRPHREVRFFAWCSACLKYYILSIFRYCKILTIFAVFHGKFWSEIFSSFQKWIKIGPTW